MADPTPADPALYEAADRLLQRQGLGRLKELQPVPGGANNRGFLAITASGRFFLKSYFRDPQDPRDRLGAEFGFASFAWAHGVRMIPQPLGADTEAGMAVYDLIPGRKLQAHEITPRRVQEALAFWKQLNLQRQADDARALANGSEACFSIDQHLQTVARRVQRLTNIDPAEPGHAEAARFIAQELVPAWSRITADCQSRTQSLGFEGPDVLPREHRCLSPSDFGFHNALLTPDDTLVFLDFEYAGWDDPAKVICDFFCQPQLPAPETEFDRFTAGVIYAMGLDPRHADRARALLPVYRIKWCCIMLNEFLPLGSRRREFALSQQSLEERKSRQLRLVRTLLSADTHITSSDQPPPLEA